MVDDDREMGEALRSMLRLLDIDLRLFTAARPAARALLDGAAPEILFIDMNMPEVTGIDLLTFVRGRPRWNNLVILMISAETSDLTIDDALRRGADGYLCKPVTMSELRQGVKDAVEKRAIIAERKIF
jgi:DNA-binding response OmpR family regulator